MTKESGKINVDTISQDQVFTVMVDYGLTLEQMLNGLDCETLDSDVNSRHYPVKGTGVVETKVRVVFIEKDSTFEKISAYIESLGFQPARIEHLIAFAKLIKKSRGQLYPPQPYPLMVTGSVWTRCDIRSLPCLEGDTASRWLTRDYARIKDAGTAFLVISS